MRKGKLGKRQKVYTNGINDADYMTQVNEIIIDGNGNKKTVILYKCPFYKKWGDMLLLGQSVRGM